MAEKKKCKLSTISEEEFIRLYNLRYTLQEIADEFGINYSDASRFLQKMLDSQKLTRSKFKFVSKAEILRENLRATEDYENFCKKVDTIRNSYLTLITQINLPNKKENEFYEHHGY